jgi:hypothetical protein
MSYNTGAICVTGTANPSGASEFSPEYIVGIDPIEMDGHKLVVITYKITARTVCL